jgi:hypothetical protein|tara:strand:+ start:2488 stop:2724 length:237 start_codon:yes stop_codon:yes gene_type:complete
MEQGKAFALGRADLSIESDYISDPITFKTYKIKLDQFHRSLDLTEAECLVFYTRAMKKKATIKKRRRKKSRTRPKKKR